ncbi:MAG: hypothetical protein ACK53Y_00295, partial [bacterium]
VKVWVCHISEGIRKGGLKGRFPVASHLNRTLHHVVVLTKIRNKQDSTEKSHEFTLIQRLGLFFTQDTGTVNDTPDIISSLRAGSLAEGSIRDGHRIAASYCLSHYDPIVQDV